MSRLRNLDSIMLSIGLPLKFSWNYCAIPSDHSEKYRYILNIIEKFPWTISRWYRDTEKYKLYKTFKNISFYSKTNRY